MKTRRADLATGLALFLAAACYFGCSWNVGLSDYDEGIRLVGGERVVAGAVPYRDFYGNYGPAQYYWPALLFRAFGRQVIVLRAGIVAVNLAATLAVWRLALACGGGRAGSSAAVLAFLLVRQGEGPELYQCDPALALLLAAGLLLGPGPLPEADRGRRGWRWPLAGALVGAAALFRQDFGVYGVVALVAALAASRGLSAGRAVGVLAGLGLTAGVGYGALLAATGFEAFALNLVVLPYRHMAYRRLPYTGLLSRTLARAFLDDAPSLPDRLATAPTLALLLVPPAAWALAAGLIVPGLAGRVRNPVCLRYLLILSVLVANYAFGRCDPTHLFPLFALVLPVAAGLLGSWLGAGATRVVGPVAVGLLALGFALVVRTNAASALAARPLPLAKARGVVLPGGPGYRDYLVWLAGEARRGSGGKPIFSGCDRHDKVMTNNVLLYFLADRPPATYYYQFDPGVTTTAAAQRRIVADLDANGALVAVLARGLHFDEPNLSRASSGVTLLDDYLRSRFQPASADAATVILRRRP